MRWHCMSFTHDGEMVESLKWEPAMMKPAVSGGRPQVSPVQNPLYFTLCLSPPVFNIPVIITNGPQKHYKPISRSNFYNPVNLIIIKPKQQTSNRLSLSSKPSCNSQKVLLHPHAFNSRNSLGLMHLNIRSLCNQFKLDHLKILVSQTDSFSDRNLA